MITIKSLTQTCDACPSQWEGLLSDGDYFYVRYRWGNLSIGFGTTINQAIRDDVYEELVGDGLDGSIEWEEVLPHFMKALNNR